MIRTTLHFDPAHSGTTLRGFWLNGQFYPIIRGADDPASGDPGTPPDGGTTPPNDEAGSGGTGTETPPDGKTFTQDEVNALVAKEVAQKTRGKLSPEELGFKTAKEMKDWVDSQRQKAEADETEADKERKASIDAARKEARDEVLTKAQNIALKAEFKIQANAAGVEFTDDAFLVAQTLDAWKGVEVDDDGNVTGLDKPFFDSFKEAKPFLFKEEAPSTPPRTPGIGAGGGTRTPPAPNRAAELAEQYPGLRSRGYGSNPQAPVRTN